MIGGQTHTVTQSGAPCTYAIARPSVSFASAGGSGSISVTADAGCGWGASSSVSWITMTSSGNGSGTARSEERRVAKASTRQGTVMIADQTHTGTQSGATGTYASAPPSASFASAG